MTETKTDPVPLSDVEMLTDVSGGTGCTNDALNCNPGCNPIDDPHDDSPCCQPDCCPEA